MDKPEVILCYKKYGFKRDNKVFLIWLFDGWLITCESLSRSTCTVNALVVAAATAREIRATAGDALVSDAADERAGLRASLVLHRESAKA